MINVKTSDEEFLFVRRWYGIKWYNYNKYVTTRKMIKNQSRIIVIVHNKLGKRKWELKFKPASTLGERADLVEKLMEILERYEP